MPLLPLQEGSQSGPWIAHVMFFHGQAGPLARFGSHILPAWVRADSDFLVVSSAEKRWGGNRRDGSVGRNRLDWARIGKRRDGSVGRKRLDWQTLGANAWIGKRRDGSVACMRAAFQMGDRLLCNRFPYAVAHLLLIIVGSRPHALLHVAFPGKLFMRATIRVCDMRCVAVERSRGGGETASTIHRAPCECARQR